MGIREKKRGIKQRAVSGRKILRKYHQM